MMSLQNLKEEYDYVVSGKRYYPHFKKKRVKSNAYNIFKRSMDMTISLFALFFFIPLFILIGIGIKLEDPHGKVFFRQQRVGKDGKIFNMYKFRSMVANAEKLKQQLLAQNEVSGAMFKMKNDPRVTKIGRFLRKTSIDELPQLWNVFIGEMSLVGPRPPLQSEVDEYTSYDMLRLTVTPGCTGLWQVSGRSTIGFREMVELDLKYIQNRSIANDILILVKTVRVLLGSKDAF
jgi:lipopolysaccharide/colanic/teichoic acid biosynthesis glycosyltransferase